MIKKVVKNKPFTDARGQYNFDLNTNLGTYPYVDDKFLDKDLYSINVGDNINEAILAYNGTIEVSNDSHFTIENLYIGHTGVNGDENNVDFKVWIIDSAHFNVDSDTGYASIVYECNKSDASAALIVRYIEDDAADADV